MLAAQLSPLALVATIGRPHVEGRIDRLSFDPDAGRLLVAALGNNTVEVVDVRSNAYVRSVYGFAEPQGIAHPERTIPSTNIDQVGVAAPVATGVHARPE